ncbi:HD domain-containing protein [Ferroacidibacillus organovorans]|uniref:HD/PDEase domain-containing protein n=1 Tax=Ferroacidibacillus organovorans TaxID=1765683 RepID=A0A101XP19_9BACL|nr:HD domain-containing protein [Ferroacidibacillus organovorans]KUO94980.1 hypothetical protein ATW55_04925 [Ferroacidibacillus organovorans]
MKDSSSVAQSPAHYKHDALRAMNRFQSDRAHCVRVASLAQTLYLGIRGEAATQAAQLTLELAGYLHDVGHFINSQKHHKHSRYLVQNARETATWDATLKEDVATLCFYHRRSARPSWIEKIGKERDLLTCCACLRVADGLDRSHLGTVTLHEIKRSTREITLFVSGLSSADADHLLRKKADLWQIAFAQKLMLNLRDAT